VSIEKMSMVNIAIDSLKNQGFEDIKAIDSDRNNIPISKSISIQDLDGNLIFTIVTLDANSTEEFQDFVYVAIEEGTNNLLEIASVSKSPKIYNDQEMESALQQKYLGASLKTIPGYFWKLESRSFLSILRRFKIDSKEMFLLPNGETINNTM
jgi:hypothetical protein